VGSPRACSSPAPGPAERGAGGWRGPPRPQGAGTEGRGGERETAKISAASAGAKRGGRQPRSETALPKFTMSLQESGGERLRAWKELGREGREVTSRAKERDGGAGEGDMLLLRQND